jgi:hypothetical protein
MVALCHSYCHRNRQPSLDRRWIANIQYMEVKRHEGGTWSFGLTLSTTGEKKKESTDLPVAHIVSVLADLYLPPESSQIKRIVM